MRPSVSRKYSSREARPPRRFRLQECWRRFLLQRRQLLDRLIKARPPALPLWIIDLAERNQTRLQRRHFRFARCFKHRTHFRELLVSEQIPI